MVRGRKGNAERLNFSLSLSLSLLLLLLLLVDFLFFENSSNRDENSRIAAERESRFRVVVGVFKGFEEDGGRILLE